MQESCTYGSVRGAPSNGRPYRNPPSTAPLSGNSSTGSGSLKLIPKRRARPPPALMLISRHVKPHLVLMSAILSSEDKGCTRRPSRNAKPIRYTNEGVSSVHQCTNF